MRKVLNNIRPVPENINIKREIISSVLIVFLGFALGYAAKAADSVSLIGDIGTHLGVWVFIVTLIAAFSRAPVMAAINAPLFFLPMLASYYLYGHFVLGFFPAAYFMGWLIVSLLSPIGGLAVWLSRGKGWIANICASLPVSILLAEGYPAYYTYKIPLMLDLLFAVILIVALPKTWRERAIVTAVSCVFAFVIMRFYLFSFLAF